MISLANSELRRAVTIGVGSGSFSFEGMAPLKTGGEASKRRLVVSCRSRNVNSPMLRMLSRANLESLLAVWYCNRVEDLDAFYTLPFDPWSFSIDGSTPVSGGRRPFARPPGARRG